MKTTVNTFAKKKANGEKISMLTCYDYSTARLLEASDVDALLVGDSVGNVMMGYDTTIPVTVDDMITYGASVVRGVKDTMVVIDMPFMSYQVSVEKALENAGRIMKETQCDAVKLEGGVRTAPQIKAMVEAGIPVMAHIGLTPQSVNAIGGHRVQGKSEEAARQLRDDALAVQEAGAFSVVLECVPDEIAAWVTDQLDIVTIGIGAGSCCDGQIMVYQDMLGMFNDFVPKFVKHFGNIGEEMIRAFNQYTAEVKAGSFPDKAHSFTAGNEVLDKLY